MKIGYAYITVGKDMEDKKVRTLHIVGESSKADAERLAFNGRVLETGVAYSNGFPVTEDGKIVCIYGVNECYVGDNRRGGGRLDTEKEYPELAALFRKLTE